MNVSYSNAVAVLIFISFVSTVYHFHIKKKKNAVRITRKKQIKDVIMFSDVHQSEMIHSKYSRYLIHPSMDRLLAYLSLARHSLDVCMYMITNCDIAHMMQKLHNRGVKIRFIVDADMAYATGSATKRIENQGIDIRWMKSTNLMHNKFCIIDASPDILDDNVIPFIMIGSLNWTTQAFRGSWENVLVLSKPAIVKGLQDEFEKLWIKFKPIDK